MKRIPVCLIAFIFIFPVCVVMAEGYKDSRENAPEGMKKYTPGKCYCFGSRGTEDYKIRQCYNDGEFQAVYGKEVFGRGSARRQTRRGPEKVGRGD